MCQIEHLSDGEGRIVVEPTLHKRARGGVSLVESFNETAVWSCV